MSEKINLNGKIINSKQAIFTANNRAFKYGDSLFETIRVFNGNIPFLSLHLNRLQKGMDILGMIYPNDFLDHIPVEINQLIQAKGNWRIRLTVFRNDGGLYTTQDNSIQFLIEKKELEKSNFELNEKGLIVGFAKEKILSYSILSELKTGNSLAYILAGIEKNKNAWDDILIRNNIGRIAEGLSSNLFVIFKNKIITPNLRSACIAGTMRQFLLEQQFVKIEEGNITDEILCKAEAVFFSNAIQGIRWISKIGGIEFSKHEIVNELVKRMNNYIKEQDS